MTRLLEHRDCQDIGTDPLLLCTRELGIIRDRRPAARACEHLGPAIACISSTDQKFRLEIMYPLGDPVPALRLISCEEIDSQTAASNALIYACWSLDLELAMDILQDLGKIIDINTLIDGKGIIDLTIGSGWDSYECGNDESIDTAIDICRLLIVCYGPTLNANTSNSLIIYCSDNKSADVVIYLLSTYDSQINHASVADNILNCLVMSRMDEVAVKYLNLYQGLIKNYLQYAIIPAVLCGSTSMFKHVVTAFQTDINLGAISAVFRILCCTADVPEWDDKITFAYQIWKDQLSTDIIENTLVENMMWVMAEKKQCNTREKRGSMAQAVIGVCIDLIQGNTLALALALCCSFSNLDLIDALLDRNLELIRCNTSLARHALIECIYHRDIDTFAHLLRRIGSCIGTDAFELWCMAGDLEGVMMVLDMDGIKELLLDCQPVHENTSSLSQALRLACQQGDADMVELLVQYFGDSIKGSDCNQAFLDACYFGHAEVMRVLAVRYPHINLYSDAGDQSKLLGMNVDHEIIILINSLLGTNIRPVGLLDTVYCNSNAITSDQRVAYGGTVITYNLCKTS